MSDAVEKVPGGGLVRVDTSSRQGTFLTTPTDRQAWLDHFGTANVPAQRQIPKAAGMNHNNYAAEKIRARAPERAHYLASREDEEPIPLPRPSVERPACARCGQALLLAIPGRTVCERCRLEAVRGTDD